MGNLESYTCCPRTSSAQKMKFSIKDFFSKCDQVRRKLRIWSHLLKKSLMKILFFVQWSTQNKLGKNDNNHQDVSPLSRLCKRKIQSVTNVPSSCSVLAKYQYRKRHDKLGKTYTGSSARNLKFSVKTNGSHIIRQCWRVKCKILWDFVIQTDKEMEHGRPSIVVIIIIITTIIISPRLGNTGLMSSGG